MKATAIAAGVLLAGVVVGPTAHADTYGDMFAAVDFLARKYGAVAYVDEQPMAYGIYAETTGSTITFNTGYVNSPDILRRDVMSDIRSGWHPGWNCTPEQYVAAHEFGHVLDNLSGRTAEGELAYALSQGLSGTVSGYSLTSYGEALAESMAAVECDVPTPAESALYTMLTT